MSTIIEHKVSAYELDVRTGALVPTTITLRFDQERFEETKRALNADRGASDSYDRCTGGDCGGDPGRFHYAVTLADVFPPKEGG
jgi:hypothetical protein